MKDRGRVKDELEGPQKKALLSDLFPPSFSRRLFRSSSLLILVMRFPGVLSMIAVLSQELKEPTKSEREVRILFTVLVSSVAQMASFRSLGRGFTFST